MRTQGSSCAEIARIIGKHRASVHREISRNVNAIGAYREGDADADMRRRRKAAKEKYRIIDNDLQLEMTIEGLMERGLSPEQVVGYTTRTGHLRVLSHQAIYEWVHRDWRARKRLLRHKGRPRVPYGARKHFWHPQKRHISERPAVVEKRRRAGDWEGDLVHGTRDDSRHAILTLVDRASGFNAMWKIRSLYPHYVAACVELALSGYPVRTITFDNGFEFGHHRTIEKALGCRVYFTDVNSPQQRGSNENFNGLLREYFPKGTSLSHVTQAQVQQISEVLNRRPRKRLGYESPRAVFAAMAGLSRYVKH